MPLCKIGSGPPVQVDSNEDCRAAGGRPVTSGDGGTGGSGNGGVCFVRNVLTRALGGVMLDIGTASAIQASMIQYLEIPPKAAASKKAGKTEFLELTPRRRQDLSARVAASIIRLGATYETMLEFVSELMQGTQRGQALMVDYNRYRDEAYALASRDMRLLYDS